MKDIHFPKRRRETGYNGGDAMNGRYFPKQPVAVEGPHDEDEDLWTVRAVDGTKFVCTGDELTPHPEAPMTNVEFLTLMMERSSTALIQPFILQAIDHYARAVVAADPAELDTGLISGEAWRATALEAMGWAVAREASMKSKAPAG